jgi:CopG family nickel-responsive transcriptional regulator
MEQELLAEFDELVEARGGTRSEAIRDLARAEVVRTKVRRGGEAIGTLSLVYDHHVRELTEKLTEMQHQLGEAVLSTLHIHLDHDHCLEVIVMQGPADRLQAAANRMIATRGVKHGDLALISAMTRRTRAQGHSHPSRR